MCETLERRFTSTGTYPSSECTPAFSRPSDSLLGTEPIAKSACVPVTTRPSSQVTVVSSPSLVMAVARAPLSRRTPPTQEILL